MDGLFGCSGFGHGGSIRQAGVFFGERSGLNPTYGAVSRSNFIAMFLL